MFTIIKIIGWFNPFSNLKLDFNLTKEEEILLQNYKDDLNLYNLYYDFLNDAPIKEGAKTFLYKTKKKSNRHQFHHIDLVEKKMNGLRNHSDWKRQDYWRFDRRETRRYDRKTKYDHLNLD